MSDERPGDETAVFASAQPVSSADLVDDETATPVETKAETRRETKPASGNKTAPGVPPWHLSATLGVVIALVGGALLWLQSPMLALIVGGALVILIGLALALRHFVGVAKTRRGGNAAGASGATGSQSQSRGRGQSRQSHERETNPFSRRRRSRRGETDETAPQSRSRRRETRKRDQSQGGETGGSTRSRRSQDRSRDRSQDRSRGRDRQPPGGNRGGRSTPSGTRTPQTLVNPPGGRPLGGGRPTGPRLPNVTQPTGPCRGVPPREKPPEALTPPPKKQPEPKTDKVTPPKVVTTKPTTTPEQTKKVVEVDNNIAWPNVDLDHYKPVRAHNLPRITAPRRAVRLPAIYHRNGDPQWPTDDPDVKINVPPQRDRRGPVATPDMLTRAQRAQHFTDSAKVMVGLAEEKDLEAHRLKALAQDTEGMEEAGAQQVAQEHLLNAGRALHDAEVRRTKAGIYTWLSRN